MKLVKKYRGKMALMLAAGMVMTNTLPVMAQVPRDISETIVEQKNLVVDLEEWRDTTAFVERTKNVYNGTFLQYLGNGAYAYQNANYDKVVILKSGITSKINSGSSTDTDIALGASSNYSVNRQGKVSWLDSEYKVKGTKDTSAIIGRTTHVSKNAHGAGFYYISYSTDAYGSPVDYYVGKYDYVNNRNIWKKKIDSAESVLINSDGTHVRIYIKGLRYRDPLTVKTLLASNGSEVSTKAITGPVSKIYDIDNSDKVCIGSRFNDDEGELLTKLSIYDRSTSEHLYDLEDVERISYDFTDIYEFGAIAENDDGIVVTTEKNIYQFDHTGKRMYEIEFRDKRVNKPYPITDSGSSNKYAINIGGNQISESEITRLNGPMTIESNGTKFDINEGVMKLESLGSGTFTLNSDIMKEVIVGDGIKKLTDRLFSGSVDLTTVDIGTGLEELGVESLMNCNLLVDIDLEGIIKLDTNAINGTGISTVYSSTLREIGSGALANNPNMREVVVENVESIGSKAFMKSGIEILHAPKVKVLGSLALTETKDLKEVVLESVETIGDSAFLNSGIEEINIPESTVSIGAKAFEGTKLNVVNNYSEHPQVIGVGAFPSHAGKKEAYGYDSNHTYKEAVIAAGYLWKGEPLPRDTTKPEILLVEKAVTSPGKIVKLEVTAQDDTELHTQAHSFDNGVTWQASASKLFVANQVVNIKVRDKAGNISEPYQVVITEIGPVVVQPTIPTLPSIPQIPNGEVAKDKDGNVMADEEGNIKDSEGNIIVDKDGNIIGKDGDILIDKDGNILDKDGNVVVDKDGNIVNGSLDEEGNIIDNEGNIIVDKDGNIVNPDGTIVIDKDGNILDKDGNTIVDKDGNIKDKDGNIIVDKDGGQYIPGINIPKELPIKDESGNTVIDADGNILDQEGNIVIDSNGKIVGGTVNPDGSITDSTGTIVIDKDGNILDKDGNIVVDKAGNVVDNTVKVESFNIISEDLTLLEGSSEQIEFEVLPANAKDKSVTWTSSNEDVAIVSNNKIIALKEGVTVISGTTAVGGFTDELIVTVKKAMIKTLEFIEIEDQSLLIKEYIKGDTYNPKGNLILTYSNGETEKVRITSSMVTHFDSNIVGDGFVEISKDGKSITYDITVKDQILTPLTALHA